MSINVLRRAFSDTLPCMWILSCDASLVSYIRVHKRLVHTCSTFRCYWCVWFGVLDNSLSRNNLWLFLDWGRNFCCSQIMFIKTLVLLLCYSRVALVRRMDMDDNRVNLVSCLVLYFIVVKWATYLMCCSSYYHYNIIHLIIFKNLC